MPSPSTPTPNEDERFIPCPPEIRDQIRELSRKFSMDKSARDARRGSAERSNKRLSHLQRTDLTDAADEHWFRRNAAFIKAIRDNEI